MCGDNETKKHAAASNKPKFTEAEIVTCYINDSAKI